MKKILSISLLCGVALAFTGCVHEEDDIFDKSAAERLNEAKDVYFSRLTDSEAGWAMEYYPTNGDEAPQGAGYLMLADFNKDNSVKVGMRNSMTGNNYLEDTSVWEVITDNGPVLSFSTYNNCVHLFSDPGIYETGLGYEGDYEFVIVDMEQGAQQGFIKGKKRGTYVRLTRLPEQTDFQEYMAGVTAFQSKYFSSAAPNNDYIVYPDSTYVLAEGSTGIPNIYPEGKDAIAFESYHPYLILKKEDSYYLRFKNVLTTLNDGSKIQEFRFDEANDRFVNVETENVFIEGGCPAPFFVESLDANSRWQINKSSEMSTSFTNVYDNVAQGFANVRYTFNNLNIMMRNGEPVLRLTYRAGNSTANIFYHFTLQQEEDGVTLQYTTPEGTAGNVLNAIPAIQTMLDTFSQKFVVSAATTRFNLSTLKFTSASNPDVWFVATQY